VHIYKRAQKARELGKMQVFGSPKTLGVEYPEEWLISLKRKVIATSYASGALSRVPWDQFEQTKYGGGRYFGKPEDYSDLYAFVRANHSHLDRYCTAGAFGPGMEDDRYGELPPVVPGEGADSLYVFLRAVPGQPEAPVVIHLVDWNNVPLPAILKLRSKAYFDGKSLKVDLLVPGRYVREEHEKAEKRAQQMREPGRRLGPAQAAAYEPLVKKSTLRVQYENGYAIVELPALEPWGMLIVTRNIMG
jgi:hypothetical protein